jgi:SNF2 family DNA or RNA helicase
MGLGKTLQSIAVVDEYRYREATDDGTGLIFPEGPKLIVCPNSVKGVWAREIHTWLGDNEPVQIIDATSAKSRHNQLIRSINEKCWTIVNYEQLRVKKEKVEIKHRNGTKSERSVEVLKEPLYELPFLAAAEPSLEDLTPHVIERARKSKMREIWMACVADEVHRAKNRRASQTKGLHRVDGYLKLAQTGTPLQNAPDELWSILHWLFPEEYTSYWRFYEDYVEYTEGYVGKVIPGVRNPDALRFELRERLVRRTKDQVLDLPEKQRVIVPVALSAQTRRVYDELESQVWIDLAEEAKADGNDALAEAIVSGDLSKLLKIPNGAARMTRLQEFLEHPSNIDADDRAKDSEKLDACEEIILDNKHTPHVVFCKYKHTTAVFAERLREKGLRVGVFTGDVPTAERTEIEDAFQRFDLDVIVGTLDAMQMGLTLTASSTEHFISRAWVPAWNEQAEDRCHRVGQRHPLTIYIYEAPDTVDDGKVRPANRLKENIVKTVLEKDHIKETYHS